MLDYDTDALDRINAAAVGLAREASLGSDVPVLISGNIGPRDDAFASSEQIGIGTARGCRSRQVNALSGANLIGAYALAYVSEAAGMALAAQDVGVPVVLSFTAGTDGGLPDGTVLSDAITRCENLTDGYPAYYMVNCVHPDHFNHVLNNDNVIERLKGVVVNASRCSHDELDEADELDPGNPTELGTQLATMSQAHPGLQVFGGCCGTDARHLREIAKVLA